MTKFTRYKYGSSPVKSSCFFMSPEAEKLFNEADEEVKKVSMALLEATIKRSMNELNQEFILKRFEELEERVSKLETLGIGS